MVSVQCVNKEYNEAMKQRNYELNVLINYKEGKIKQSYL